MELHELPVGACHVRNNTHLMHRSREGCYCSARAEFFLPRAEGHRDGAQDAAVITDLDAFGRCEASFDIITTITTITTARDAPKPDMLPGTPGIVSNGRKDEIACMLLCSSEPRPARTMSRDSLVRSGEVRHCKFISSR